jgi:hypothetical protein
MRLQKIIKLDDKRTVTLLELRVRDARQIMAQAKNLEQVEIKTLLNERFDELAALLGDCIQCPKGETLDDLSFGELQLIKDGLLEINAAFLDLLGLAGLFRPIPSPDLTAPASPLLREGIPVPPITAGDFS